MQSRIPDLVLSRAERLYVSPDRAPLHDATLLLRDGCVAEILSGDPIESWGGKTLDCRGCSIAAGFWNAHVHFHERKWANAAEIPSAELNDQLQELTRYGFTSVFDLSSSRCNTRRLRERIERDEIAGPRIFSTGEGLIPAGGAPSAEFFRALGLMETALTEVSGAPEARRRVRELLAADVDAIKLFLSTPSAGRLDAETIRAAIDEAHAAGKLVFAHPNDADDVRAALQGGVDVIAHTTPRSGVWDDDLVKMMRSRAATLIPTLMLWRSLMRHDRLSVRERLVTTAVEQLRVWLDGGGTVIFGTDLGAVEYDPTDEYELMAAGGATFSTILRALTTAPAEHFRGNAALGEVRAGNAADLVVLEGDPASDVAEFARVRWTLRDGRIVYRSGDADGGNRPDAETPASGGT